MVYYLSFFSLCTICVHVVKKARRIRLIIRVFGVYVVKILRRNNARYPRFWNTSLKNSGVLDSLSAFLGFTSSKYYGAITHAIRVLRLLSFQFT